MCTEISQVDGNLAFIGNSSNEFVASLKLYKLTALNHWGKIDKFNRLARECLPDFQSFFETGENIEIYLKFVNRFVVNLQDVFDYDESLKLGNFDIACQIIDSALNISIKNPKAEDFKNFSV